MKKLLSLVLALMMLVSVAFAAEFTPAAEIELPVGKTAYALPADVYPEEPIKLAMVGSDLNEFSLLVKEGMTWAKEALADRNCVVDYYALTQFDAVGTEQVLRNCMTLGYDGVSCFGFSEVLQPVIQEMADEGIVVTTWNTDAGVGSARMGYFGEDPFPATVRLGEYAKSVLGEEGGQYATITGSFSVFSHQERCRGFNSVFAGDEKWELVSETENGDKSNVAYDTVSQLLLAYPDLKFVYVAAGGPEGAAKAIQDAGMTGKVKLFCHDWTQETVRYAKSGEVTGCLDQDPFNQGAAPLICMFNYLAAGTPIEDLNYFSGGILTPENVNEYYPD